jgi:hypothetical protein
MKLVVNLKTPAAGDAVRRIGRRVRDAAKQALRPGQPSRSVVTKEPGR